MSYCNSIIPHQHIKTIFTMAREYTEVPSSEPGIELQDVGNREMDESGKLYKQSFPFPVKMIGH